MKKIHGFTLIELTAVILILGIISATVVLRLPNFSAYDLTSQSTSVLRDLQLTQALALAYDKTYKIVFTSSSYQIQDAYNNFYTFTDTNSTTVNLPSDITLSSSTSTLSFNYLGEPADSSNSALTAVATVTLTASNGDTQQITIQPQTGFSQ